jgi:ABC-type multidrug transport system fused ATPase/permease subunit
MLAHINAISVPLTTASSAVNAASIFFTIIDAPKPSTDGLLDDDVRLDADIVLKDINFAYPARHDVRILNGLSLCIPAGKTTAIVGPSGSGKSTVVALIERWFELGGSDPIANYLRNGRIAIGNRNLSEVDLRWWRAQIGMVQQDLFLFNDTIYHNVECGLVGTNWEAAPEVVKRQLVIKACKEAYADEFISLLPEVGIASLPLLNVDANPGRAIQHQLANQVLISAAAKGRESPSLELLYANQRY